MNTGLRQTRGIKRRTIYSAVFRFSALVTVAALTVSCSIIKPPPTPEQPVELPGTFSHAGEDILKERWWESFEDEELNELVKSALAGNLQLLTVWDRLDQASALARKAGSQRWPSLSAEASASKTRSEGPTSASPQLTGDETATTNRFSLGLSAGYEIDLWGRVKSSLLAAELDAVAGKEDLSAAAMTLSSQVTAAWYKLVQQRALLKLLDEQVKTNQEFLELAELRFKNGKTSAVDVLQQKTQLEATKGQIPLTKMQVKLLEHQLAVLAGIAPPEKVTGTRDELKELPPAPATGLPAELVLRRPDLRKAYTRLAAANQHIAAAVADRFPSIRLTSGAQTDSDEVDGLFDNWLASLAGSLVGPIIDGGSRKAEVERNRAVASERLHAYGQLVLDAMREVEDALAQEQYQREYLESIEKQIDLAGQVMKRSRLRYINGATDYLPVLEALRALQKLERTSLEVERMLTEYRIALYRSLGGSWEMVRVSENEEANETDSGEIE